MKPILLLGCLIFSWNFLFAQDKQLNILLQTVENRDLTSLMQLKMPELNLNQTHILFFILIVEFNMPVRNSDKRSKISKCVKV